MNDPTLVRLAKVIQKGWPEHAKELADDIKIYFPYRFVLHIVSGIIFIHNRIVVPELILILSCAVLLYCQ